MKDDVFVIGDVHGHYEELSTLLTESGATRDGVEVIQLGDLGHFGTDSKDRDFGAYMLAQQYIDLVLWGNHDRAVVDRGHLFGGYGQPEPELVELLHKTLMALAAVRHGYLLTHAGVHPAFARLFSGAPIEEYPRIIAEHENGDLVNAISYRRGGWQSEGGILWRDYDEKLWDVPQIFGHTRGDSVREDGQSYCIDICPREGGMLCGMWLPSKKIVMLKDGSVTER